jgi:hypothetical protein
MRQTLHVCFLAGMLMLVTAKAAGAPFAGTWEGKIGGRKAVTLQILEDGARHGTAVFYITDDNRDGSHNGDALPPIEIETPTRDGTTLRFTLTVGKEHLAFVMKITGAGRAELHRLPNGGRPELVIPLTAIR